MTKTAAGNTSRASTSELMSTKNSVGESSGSVIRRNFGRAAAPSIEAASYRWGGMFWSPAR